MSIASSYMNLIFSNISPMIFSLFLFLFCLIPSIRSTADTTCNEACHLPTEIYSSLVSTNQKNLFQFPDITSIPLFNIQDGKKVDSMLQVNDLFENNQKGIIFFIIRRVGCVLCREHAQSLIKLLQSKDSKLSTSIQSKIQLIGIIKEIAPLPGAETDEILGTSEFQNIYFNKNQLYYDETKQFYQLLGNNNLLWQKWSSWNPIQLYKDFKTMSKRLQEKNIEGNLKGDGFLQGGIVIVSPKKEVVYIHKEQTGYELPIGEIIQIINENF